MDLKLPMYCTYNSDIQNFFKTTYNSDSTYNYNGSEDWLCTVLIIQTFRKKSKFRAFKGIIL